MALVIRSKLLLDAKSDGVIDNGAVVIENKVIAQIGRFSTLAIPVGARVIDLSEHTLTPGLIDVHSHVTIETSGNEHAQASQQEAEVALWGAHWLGKDLRSGVTTMRTLGDRRFIDLIFRRLQEAGVVGGPRLRVAGNLLQSSLVHVSITDATADGPDAIRRYIREAVQAGADWVKFYATPNSRAPDPIQAIYSKEEVELIFAEARRIGRPVSVHCHGGLAADWCIELDADSLEHGLYLEEPQFREMARKGIVLVPTTTVVLVQTGSHPRLLQSQERARTFLRQARKHGVKCIPGTDAVHGALASEILMMIHCGWSPMEAIQAATREAAGLLRMDPSIGTLEVGKLADLVAFRGKVLDDPEGLRKVDLVIQDGRIVHRADGLEVN